MQIRLGRSKASLGLCAVVAAFALGACTGPKPATGPTEEDLRTALAESLGAPGEAQDPAVDVEAAVNFDESLMTLYKARDFNPIWVGPDGANARGRLLLEHLSEADLDALDPARYGVEEVLGPLALGDARSLASAEVYFSRALMRYAADLKGIPFNDVTVVAAAGAAVDFGGYLDSLVPQDPAYRRLRAAMRLYGSIVGEGGWEAIPDGGTLRNGNSNARVISLRRRLGATGDLAAAEARSDSELFDEAVAAAVSRFQERHGLVADGIAGKRTLRILNVPAEARVAQIAEGLERHRRGEFKFGDRALIVNVAAQDLVLIDRGNEVLRSRTIIGQPGWATPLMRSKVNSVIVNPTWTVPRSIAAQEIIPAALKKGRAEYLAKRGFELLDTDHNPVDPETVDWDSLNIDMLPFVLRQAAGPGNALGRVKFQFPNKEFIYLHDTPGRSLFDRTYRALSHGCVRVEKSDELALHLLRMGARWTEADYRKALESGETTNVWLKQAVPLHIVSITVWVEEDGTVQFRNNPYLSDKTNKNKRKSNNSV